LDFNELAWAAVCFSYRSLGDSKYVKIIRDGSFIRRLRTAPSEINTEELEQKLVLDYIRVESYDLLVGHKLAGNILTTIGELEAEISSLSDISLLECDLSDADLVEKIRKVYEKLGAIYGLWLTGASKIAHILNDRLFVILSLDLSRHFKILENGTGLVQCLSVMQEDGRQVTRDFQERGFQGSPEQFLSENLGYADLGYHKSLVKFLDEYYWLRFGDNLPIPPRWTPYMLSKIPEPKKPHKKIAQA
jgi:hypothetical protein